MVQTKEFQAWHRVETARRLQGKGQKSIDELVDEEMTPDKLRIEVRCGDSWCPEK